MSELRAIDVSGFAYLPPRESCGAAPQLMWIAIADLGVDDSYQREINRVGHQKVRGIAEHFDWDFFAPVIVSPVSGGRFAIIDGQHRTTGALLAGHDKVPCSVILADRRKQASAFEAINGNITRVTPLQRFKAKLAAEEPEALRLNAVAARAGVRLRFSQGGVAKYARANDCFALVALQAAMEKFGDDVAEWTLRCILASADNEPGLFRSVLIRCVSEVLAENPAWLSAPELLAAFIEFDLHEEQHAAQARARTSDKRREALKASISAYLTATLAGRGVA